MNSSPCSETIFAGYRRSHSDWWGPFFSRLSFKAVVLMLFAMTCVSAQAAEKAVRIYGWADYVPTETLKKFEEKTGIKVQYDTFDSVDVLETKMLTGASGYDVVMPGAAMVGRLIQAKALRPSQMSGSQTMADADPQLLAQLAEIDPGNAYAIPYTWGTTGLAFNRQAVAKRIPNPPINSLDLLFKPEYASRLKDCGIAIIDSPQEVISIVLNYLGKPPFSKDPADLKQADELLSQLHPSLRYIRFGTQMSDLANGDICLALTYNGDAIVAKNQALAAHQAFDIDFSVPVEGTMAWVDTLSIPADAPHPEEARTFIAFVTSPESMADVTTTLFYANANKAATQLLPKDISDNPSIYPSAALRAKLFGEQPLPARIMRERTRLWASFRTQR